MSDGTIANEAVASTEGQVASGSVRLKTTVSLSGASTLFMFASSEEAPFGIGDLDVALEREDDVLGVERRAVGEDAVAAHLALVGDVVL